MDTRKLVALIGIITLAITVVFLAHVVVQGSTNKYLMVSFFDVGQGDATFIQSPSGAQMLIDGGPDRSVLRSLSDVMPFHDRSIDVVLATHPDTDHVGGLFEVLKRYEVSHILRPGVAADSEAANSLLLEIANEGATEKLARRGDRIDLGGGVHIDILFPDRDISGLETNAASIILKLTYGGTSFLFSGDSPQSIEKYIASLDGENLEADVLQVGHHGSKTSSSLEFIGFASPEYGVISRGCNNRYGHPHTEVLETLERFEVSVLDTCEEGTITFFSDGSRIWLK